MAYEKQTWINGDVITQEKLNHIEDGIEDAYELPAVTETDNGKVLGVENGAWSVVNGGGGGGVSCVEIFTETVVCSETESNGATATFADNTPLNAGVITVVINGVRYRSTPRAVFTDAQAIYGFASGNPTPDYPFTLMVARANNFKQIWLPASFVGQEVTVSVYVCG